MATLTALPGRAGGFEQAFISVAGGTSKLADFDMSVAACLTSGRSTPGTRW
ncbi:hypothetical protein [Amycolatopsis viridis]|uniref:Uncharacterized protein n=1 Tax=Amycolatopsis viridis TaxID=185678 RepID=A0ABX0SV27_9PSEU|nr:hypothetical protein [Amycolatopsis viridis]NIH80475.1 hypothetical protein [Amycolatopsis viridis]